MKPMPEKPKKIIQTLKEAGYEAYAVGGSVRDSIMNRQTHGWDFATDATPEQVMKLFPDSFYDNTFGTVGIKIFEDKYHATQQSEMHEINTSEPHTQPIDIYEITTYRSEKGYADLRHPDHVTWGKSIEQDLSRRDFTINAIAWDGNVFVDPFGGRDDIAAKIIRTVGNPHARFREDALRIMRAVRIASELGFTIEEPTILAIRDHVHLLDAVSAERIRDELMKILKSPYPADGILILRNTRILQKILPELDKAFAVPQQSPKRHHIYDVGTHSVEALRHCPSVDPIVRLATLLHDIGKVGGNHDESHVQAGIRIAKQYGMPQAVIDCIAQHHEDEPFSSPESMAVYIADAISGARPGARYENHEDYQTFILSRGNCNVI